jgi:hypothetical protein
MPAGMAIRPLERPDLPSVSALVRGTLGLGPPGAEPALAAFLRRTLIEQPWSDPEIPSLVALDADGQVVGFVAAEVRRVRVGGRPLRFAWAAHTAVAPASRSHAAGFLLMRSLLEGPQDATLGDGASPLMEQMWLRLGGRRLEQKGIHWVRVFRPASVAAHLVPVRRARLRAGMRAAAGRLDDLTSPFVRRVLAPALTPPREEALTPPREEALTPAAMLDAWPRVARGLVVHADYDEGFIDWLFHELRGVRARGELVTRLVKDARARPLGWYVYFLRPGWRSEVLQVAATSERALGVVLDHLLAHAYAHGSAAVRGRLEPGMLDAVARRRCVLWHRGAAVAHARDPHVLATIESPHALLTRLDGDPWIDVLVDVVR